MGAVVGVAVSEFHRESERRGEFFWNCATLRVSVSVRARECHRESERRDDFFRNCGRCHALIGVIYSVSLFAPAI